MTATDARRRLRFILALCAIVLFSMPLYGCVREQSQAPEAEEKAYSRYEAPVALRVGYTYADIALPEGEMGDNHFLNRYIEEQLGVKIKYDWDASGNEQYRNKLEFAIRSNDLPDAFIVTRDQYHMLVQRDMLEDLTEYYEPYASELVKSIYMATDGRALREASINGRLFAMPIVKIEADSPSYVWIRQDWLDKLKLPPPKTLDDLERIVRAFIEEDPDGNGKPDTIGIPVDHTLVFGEGMEVHGLNSVFTAYHAFPKYWIKDAQGKVVYGSIQPEAKAALARLADWYRDGIIDRDFLLRKETLELIENHHSGVIFAPWWAPYWPLGKSVAKDTKAEWRVYAAPVDANGIFMTNRSPSSDRYLVVRKGYSHPEAVLKVLNLLTRLERNRDPNEEKAQQLRNTAARLGALLRNYYPFDLLLDYPDAIEQRYDSLIQALNGSMDAASLEPFTKALYESALEEREAPRKNMDAWSASQAYLLGGAVSKLPREMKESLFYGTTPSMEKYWPDLQRLEYDTYLKIITGELPIEAFDQFAQQWKAQGGDRIAAEVAEAVA
ncbi:extracellular solute-binding protein [Paenibacillaceae bacterium WGS1546]|uniref:extracellular solute-binding protein n=1 Tax=Cohnella sp. WGS1546 TaxID=3366810 RepID=UPI00372D7550